MLPGAAGRKVRIEERVPPSRAGTDVLAALLLDYHGSKVKTAESPGVSRARIYRKIRQYGIITPAS